MADRSLQNGKQNCIVFVARTEPYGKRKFRMHWVGYGANEDQWVREEDVTDELIKDYEAKCQRRRHHATEGLIECTTMANTLAMAQARDTTISSDDSARFNYEIRVPRQGQSRNG